MHAILAKLFVNNVFVLLAPLLFYTSERAAKDGIKSPVRSATVTKPPLLQHQASRKSSGVFIFSPLYFLKRKKEKKKKSFY